jgi:hypothetical protein
MMGSSGVGEVCKALMVEVPKRRRGAPPLSLTEGVTPRLNILATRDLLPPSGRIFGFAMVFSSIAIPKGSSPMVGFAAMVLKLCIRDGGQGPYHVSKMSVRSFFSPIYVGIMP